MIGEKCAQLKCYGMPGRMRTDDPDIHPPGIVPDGFNGEYGFRRSKHHHHPAGSIVRPLRIDEL